MKKSSLPGFSILILISISSMFGLGSVVRKTYTHMPLHYTWEEARSVCKSLNSHLAIVQTEEDKEMIKIIEYYAWIGLIKDIDSGLWIWRTAVSQPAYTWADGEPQPTDSCASIFYSARQVYGFPCEDYLFSFCARSTILKFVAESKALKEAEEYCLQNGMELAKLLSFDDITQIDAFEFSLWIQAVDGSYEPGSEPDQSAKCGSITTETKTIAARDCNDHLPSVCMTDNVILIKKKKTWEEAMRHCRELVLSTEDKSTYELISVDAGKDEGFLRARALEADTEQVWVGLRFLGVNWFWINGVSMMYPKLPECPPPGKNCGVISKMAANMETADCGEKKNFLCYKLDDISQSNVAINDD